MSEGTVQQRRSWRARIATVTASHHRRDRRAVREHPGPRMTRQPPLPFHVKRWSARVTTSLPAPPPAFNDAAIRCAGSSPVPTAAVEASPSLVPGRTTPHRGPDSHTPSSAGRAAPGRRDTMRKPSVPLRRCHRCCSGRSQYRARSDQALERTRVPPPRVPQGQAPPGREAARSARHALQASPVRPSTSADTSAPQAARSRSGAQGSRSGRHRLLTESVDTTAPGRHHPAGSPPPRRVATGPVTAGAGRTTDVGRPEGRWGDGGVERDVFEDPTTRWWRRGRLAGCERRRGRGTPPDSPPGRNHPGRAGARSRRAPHLRRTASPCAGPQTPPPTRRVRPEGLSI